MNSFNPYHDVTRYIEDQAFRGRSVEDILNELRSSGWSEQHIHAAVSQLNQQHDVLQQIDMDPLHRSPVRQSSKKLIIVSALVALLLYLAVFFVVRTLRTSATFVTFDDPNFTMQVPEDWVRDDRYTPGASVMFFHSQNQSKDEPLEGGAFMTLYLNLFEDQFGRQLLSGESSATITNDRTVSDGGVVRRYVTYEQPGTVDRPQSIRGAYALVTKGELTVSITVASRAEDWSTHSAQAERILMSVTPNCSIKNLDALYDEQGAIILCQDDSQ